jgi:hypothetical protein
MPATSAMPATSTAITAMSAAMVVRE